MKYLLISLFFYSCAVTVTGVNQDGVPMSFKMNRAECPDSILYFQPIYYPHSLVIQDYNQVDTITDFYIEIPNPEQYAK